MIQDSEGKELALVASAARFMMVLVDLRLDATNVAGRGIMPRIVSNRSLYLTPIYVITVSRLAM